MVRRRLRLVAPLLLGCSGLSAALRRAESSGLHEDAVREVGGGPRGPRLPPPPSVSREAQRRVVIQPGNASDPFEKAWHFDDWQSSAEHDFLKLGDPICVTRVGSADHRCSVLSHRLCSHSSMRVTSMNDTRFRGPEAKCFRRRSTCAVVGSSHHLLSETLGKSIDEHDVVIRINAAPAGSTNASSERYRFGLHVGTRTDVRFLNGYGDMPAVPESSDPMCLFLHEPMLPEICGKYCWRNPGLCNISCTGEEAELLDHATRQMVCSQKPCDLDKFQCRGSRQKREEPDWGDHYVFLDNLFSGIVDLVVPHSTAGFKAVIYAMSICDSVSIMGFGPSCAGHVGGRYYDSETGVLKWHHYEEELALLMRAEKLGTKVLVPPEARRWITAQKVQVMLPKCVSRSAVSTLDAVVKPLDRSTPVNRKLKHGERSSGKR